MTLMKLYYNPLSPNVRRVRLTAAVLGLELEEKLLDFSKGEHKTPEYLALNPNGAVPTLVDGDFVLSESRSIMQYLASKKPEAGLLPRDEAARADVTRWQFWDAAHFSPHLGTIAFERMIKGMIGLGDPDSAKVNDALTNFRRFAAVLNQRLEGRQYVVGNSLTLADLTLASSLMYAKQTEVVVAEFPNVERWFARMIDLDGWKKTSG
ncbi:MAG TPA: glutathione S-transferase family protein [Polyangiaceae bacterium]|nr:glutathione S-transferase family protein [Polyangiaceae bacterium]HYQ25799.1 glutathione S-transferase family protein [Polyangiaceae bacterium]